MKTQFTVKVVGVFLAMIAAILMTACLNRPGFDGYICI